MNAIPLINNIPKTNINNEKQLRQEINTSLVALKKEAGTLEGLINEAAQMLVTINNRIATLENDTVKKSDIVDVVQSGNLQPVTSNAVADKISSLDVSSVGGSGKYISAISETDGKINATSTDLATSVASGNNAPVTSDAVNSYCQVTRKVGSYNLTNSGYVLLAHIQSSDYQYNHDVSIAGRAFCGRPSGAFWYYFNAYVRGRGSAVSPSVPKASMSIFDGQSMQGNQYFTISYKVVGNTYHIYIYAKCIESYMRHYLFLDFASIGDVFPFSSVFTPNYIETPLTVFSSIPSDQTILYGN